MPTPINQLLSQTRYATDGTTTEWDFSFSGGYLLKSHVKAHVETPAGAISEVVVTEGMLTGPFTLRILPALPAGNVLVIYRDTPKDLPLVDFTDESGFSEVSLDTNAKQAVFIAAETTDTVKTSTQYEAEQAARQAAIAAGEAQASAIAAAASALLSANEAAASEVSAINSANSAASSSAAATAVFNANTTTYTRTLLEDTTANAARATLGAAASGANTDITSIAGNAATATKLLNDTGSAPSYSCRAWVNFNGTGTVSIRASGNVSSITDNGVGDYTVNFTSAMLDANYAVSGTAGPAGGTYSAVSYLAGSCRTQTLNAYGALVDNQLVSTVIFR